MFSAQNLFTYYSLAKDVFVLFYLVYSQEIDKED